MSISRRTAVAVRTLGVASAATVLSLGFAGSAFACNIADFHGSVACDSSSGTATVTVTDDDSTGHTATVELSYGGTQIGTTQTVVGNAKTPGQVVFSNVPWETSGSWTATVNVPGAIDNQTVSIPASDATCSAPTTPAPPTTPPATPSTPPSSAPASSAPASPSGGSSVSATASPVSSVSAVATVSASPTGPALAETGGGNDSGLIAGIAGALVIAGGGVVFALRRRSAAGRH